MSSPFPASRLATADAAAYLGLSPATLEKWRVQGGGPPFERLGRSVRYKVTALDAWASERSARNTSDARAAEARRASA